jgi:hypothetical protein
MSSTATTFISSINTAFPVAGQDNDTQGFRDNSANIKNGMQAIANEVSEIQSIGVVKNATNNFSNTGIIQNAVLQSVSHTRILPSAGVIGGNQTVDFTSGNYQVWKITSATNLSFVNFPTAKRSSVQLELYRDVDTTTTVAVTIVASTSTRILLDTKSGAGVTNPISLTTSSPVLYEVSSTNGGTDPTLYVRFLGGPFKAA